VAKGISKFWLKKRTYGLILIGYDRHTFNLNKYQNSGPRLIMISTINKYSNTNNIIENFNNGQKMT